MSTIYFVTMIFAALYVAVQAAFIILFIGKIGIRDNVIAKAPKLISQMFDCDFCLSFWVSLILAVILAIFFGQLNLLLIPILSTPITKVLL